MECWAGPSGVYPGVDCSGKDVVTASVLHLPVSWTRMYCFLSSAEVGIQTSKSGQGIEGRTRRVESSCPSVPCVTKQTYK